MLNNDNHPKTAAEQMAEAEAHWHATGPENFSDNLRLEQEQQALRAAIANVPIDPALAAAPLGAPVEQFNLVPSHDPLFIENFNNLMLQQAQQTTNFAPGFVQDPIAQGFQNNAGGIFGAMPGAQANVPTFPTAAINNQLETTMPFVQAPEPEHVPETTQVPGFADDSASEDEEDFENFFEAENLDNFMEPVAFENPSPVLAPEDVMAISRLQQLTPAQRDLAIAQIQAGLPQVQNGNVQVADGGFMDMMADQMDLDEQVDGIPNFSHDPHFLNNLNTSLHNIRQQAQPTQAVNFGNQQQAQPALNLTNAQQPAQPANNSNSNTRLSIHHIRLPAADDRDDMDRYIMECRNIGASYKEIREVGGFKEAESTLRGRYRTITKLPQERVRRPRWTVADARILFTATMEYVNAHGLDPTEKLKLPWKSIENRMQQLGVSYRFGYGTLSRMWTRIVENEPLDLVN
ncbi:hypothetical protein ACHAPT_002371 [Fusarium lateritium]